MTFIKTFTTTLLILSSLTWALRIPYNEKIGVLFDFSQELSLQVREEEVAQDPYFEALFKKFENSHVVQDKHG